MNDLFAGFVVLEATLTGLLLTTITNGTPTDADVLPTYRVYGPSGFLLSGVCSLLDAAATDGTYTYTIDATAVNGFASGQNYNVLFSCIVSGVTRGVVHSFMVA